MNPTWHFLGDEITKPSQKSEISRPRHHLPAMRWLETRSVAPGGGRFVYLKNHLDGSQKDKPWWSEFRIC